MKFLLMPAAPTPNGKLHLGHISGPFLKLDIIKRFNCQIGNQAFLCSGIDVYDSYIYLEVLNTEQKENTVCNYFYKCIIEDLKKMQIEMDIFINPVAQEWSQKYMYTTQELSKKLLSNSIYVRKITEKYPYTEKFGYLLPSLIKGVCRICNEPMRGFVCEQCALIHMPEEIRNKKCFLGSLETEDKEVDSWFVKIDKPKIADKISSMNLPKEIFYIVDSYLRKSDFSRLTIPVQYGIPADSTSVYYNQGTFFPYCVFLGEVCREKQLYSSGNPFEAHSNFKIVHSFGFDNINGFMVDTLNYSLCFPEYKFTDYFLTNYFLTLKKEKFSTSRNNAIFVDNLSDNVSIDILRLFLLKQNCDNFQSDFDINQFVAFHNEISFLINTKLEKLFSRSNHYTCEERYIFSLKEKQNFMMPWNYSGEKVYQTVYQWICEEISNISSIYAWFKTFSVLIYPIMPQFSLSIWLAMGEEGLPAIEKLNTRIIRYPSINIKKIPFVHNSDIRVI